jgi:two-component system chemotaxis response regulator CheV
MYPSLAESSRHKELRMFDLDAFCASLTAAKYGGFPPLLATQIRAWAAQQGKGQRISNWLALVISDIEMPKMDGYSLTRLIREDPELNDLHILLHSSLSGVFNENMVKKVGANHFLPKYEPDELAVAIQGQLIEHAAEHGYHSGQ